MKKNLVLSILLIFIASNHLLGQSNEKKPIDDSIIIFGIIETDNFVGKSITDYCTTSIDKELKKETAVIITGVKKCTKSYSSVSTDFYEINYNSKTYFIEKDKLSIYDYTFEELYNMPLELAQKFKEHSTKISEMIYTDEAKSALKFLDNCKTSGLAIYEWSYYDESEYTDGTSGKITVYNPTNKTIKYLWFNFIGYNAVGDKVIDGINRTSLITKKGIGPIKKGETGTYDYKYIWHTDIVEKAKIVSIKVQYMDGSIKQINNPKSIILSERFKNILDVNLPETE